MAYTSNNPQTRLSWKCFFNCRYPDHFTAPLEHIISTALQIIQLWILFATSGEFITSDLVRISLPTIRIRDNKSMSELIKFVCFFILVIISGYSFQNILFTLTLSIRRQKISGIQNNLIFIFVLNWGRLRQNNLTITYYILQEIYLKADQRGKVFFKFSNQQ